MNDTLTRAGLEALRYKARGWSHAQTARECGVTEDAVRSRLVRLYEILGARNTAHAIAIAGVKGLLTRDDLMAAVADRRPGWDEPEVGVGFTRSQEEEG
jgi:DNA-binding CsgD family transcriptional regulator